MRRLTIAAIAPTMAAVIVLLMGGQPAAAQEAAMQEQDVSRGIWLRTEAVEAFVALAPRFRVLSIRRPGEVSLSAGVGVAEQGLRLAFMEPDQVPGSFDVGNVPAEVLEQSDTSLRVRLQPAAGLQYTVTLTLDPAIARIKLQYTLTNVGEAERRVAPWSVIAFARDGTIIVPFDDQPRKRRRIVLPWWGDWPQPGVRIGRDALLSDASVPLAGTAYKIGVITNAAWVAFVRGGQVLVSRVRFDAEAQYPEDGANITVFHAAGEQRIWCETEQMGPLRTLPPGESTTMVETIELGNVTAPANPTPDTWRAAIEAAGQDP